VGNIKHAGFYRVNYDELGWEKLIEELKNNHTLLDSTSRALLIDDSFN
jgi:aminopeptidase N